MPQTIRTQIETSHTHGEDEPGYQGRRANLQGVALELAAGQGLHADGAGVVLERGRAVDGQSHGQDNHQAST